MTPEELQELCALYVLGALEPQEAGAIEARLQAGDPDAVREVTALREVVALLPYALPPVPPDPAVRAHLMTQIQTTLPMAQVQRTRTARRSSGWLRALPVWLPTTVAAMLVLISGWLVYDLRLQVTTLETEVQQLRGVAGEHERLLALLTVPEVKIVTLAGTEHAPKAGARVLWDAQREEWTVISHDLPPLPLGKAYQLWFLPSSGAPIPAGTFQPDSHSRGIIQAKLPPRRTDIAGAAVSLEPAGGVLQPTGNLVLAGKF
jgi:anti-sigma-K factor RskA